jgi:hypothetical protein
MTELHLRAWFDPNARAATPEEAGRMQIEDAVRATLPRHGPAYWEGTCTTQVADEIPPLPSLDEYAKIVRRFPASIDLGTLYGCPVSINPRTRMITVKLSDGPVTHITTFRLDHPFIKGTRIEAAARAALAS